MAILVPGLPHGHNILGRNVALNVMHGAKDEPSARGKIFDPALRLFPDLLRGSMREDGLRIAAAATNSHVFAEVLFECLGVHATGADLPRIQNVDPALNHIWHDICDCAAAMEKDINSVFSPGFNKFN